MTDLQVNDLYLYSCPVDGCDRSFPSKNGLQGHMIAHRPPVACPECGKEYRTPGALGNHRKMTHHVEGPWAKKAASRRNGKLPDIEVDHIFASVLQVLFPNGTMPIAAVVPLLQWREATQVFLEQVQS